VLFTSTVLTLVLLPVMYEWVEQRRERQQAARTATVLPEAPAE
jgi:hypothetical protein